MTPSRVASDDSSMIDRWIALDSGWKATALGLFALVCSFAVRLL